ncbi:MAG: FAD-binding oxidoreductase [Halothiobacillus sp. 24-54-40]|jgi:D-lactate dehydrogenase|nr:FAD-binding protein [Halothiobacillaceae bacterium]OYV47164.1 MAG: FAD-binding oxidoreductase [Halothiobacillus sp. 20-53-49]OYY34477.1 MAG: FAD-binding oxidoreductase [Halothiobacillus sp. 35-54-62]OYZ86217.1 MAG: FAD-binding oxidoreductase [Halothiobacillus sp. 24-54-40]OZA79872.1 MAG: FAD-binding oxidoreductase [Halothiobacillus sp. 39-53-45]HQS03117.1 FAD-linked oxidase C-terminal domain-containing protein [Halothiobacillus sp.]
MRPTAPDIQALAQALGRFLPAHRFSIEPATCWAYGMDNSRLHHPPHMVVFPENHTEVQQLVQLARRYQIPITPRGRGTGTAGGSVPLEGGMVVVLDRMNQVLEFRPEDRLIRVQSGLINSELQQIVSAAGFFWPPDPTSQALCTIGGNLGCNAAGPHAVKYGTTRDNVLGLVAVAGTGETLIAGTQTTKGVVGYDLTRLMIGSEGTLGIITEITLKLTPLPDATKLVRVFYRDMHAASLAVSRLMNQPATPSAIEFIDGNALNLMRQYSKNPETLAIPPKAGALLLIEIDGLAESLSGQIEKIRSAATGDATSDSAPIALSIAQSASEIAALWAARKALSPTLRHIAPKKINEDVVVPVSRIPALIAAIDASAAKHALKIVNFGHAGNGNIHVNLLIDPQDPSQLAAGDAALAEIFSTVLALNGTLSGEHGVGAVKREYIRAEIDPASLALMRGIKAVFDPDGIMNPQKKLPDTLQSVR